MQLFRVLRVNDEVLRVATTARVLRRPMDETIDGDGSEMIDKDGKEKVGTTFPGRQHVSRRLSYLTLREVPLCACVSLVMRGSVFQVYVGVRLGDFNDGVRCLFGWSTERLSSPARREHVATQILIVESLMPWRDG